MIYSFFLKNLVGEKLSGRRGRKKEKEREREYRSNVHNLHNVHETLLILHRDSPPRTTRVRVRGCRWRKACRTQVHARIPADISGEDRRIRASTPVVINYRIWGPASPYHPAGTSQRTTRHNSQKTFAPTKPWMSLNFCSDTWHLSRSSRHAL